MTLNRFAVRLLAGILAIFAVGGVAAAQDASQAQGTRTERRGGWWDTDYMLDWYVKGLTRAYNLTSTQEEFTRKLLTKRVKDFLKVHETDMRRLMWEMTEYQMKRQIPDPETAKDWAKTGDPVFKAAREAIMKGNTEWREILDDEQKKRHDQDLKGLEDYFKVMDDRIERWGKGDIQERDLSPAGQRPNAQISGETWAQAKPEDAWEIYLRGFARRFNLNDAQRETGESILRECKRRAGEYREKQKPEFDAVEAKISQLQAQRKSEQMDGDKLSALNKELAELGKRKYELQKPIFDEIGKEFRRRLDEIPTSEQRTAFADKQKAQMEAAKARGGARQANVEGRPATQPAAQPVAPTSQPR